MAHKALLVRLDKIGDLVLTLPADQQPALASYDCTWIVAKNMGFVPDRAIPQRKHCELSKQFSMESWRELWSILKRVNPDVTVSFQAPWWVNFAFFIYGVRLRIGVLSKWHSYVFLNRGVRQKRSEAKFNELEYNHQLIHEGFRQSEPVEYPYLRLREKSGVEVSGLPESYVVVHPGMAGSARNWSPTKYVEFIGQIASHQSVVITGTAADRPYIEPIKNALGNMRNVIWMNEKLNVDQLIHVLARAGHLVAPSTGVLHLAASLGTPVIGIYSPVQVQTAKRWGPKGKNAQTLTPKVDCPGHFSCLYEKCPHFDCMELVTSTEIYKTIQHDNGSTS